MKFSSFRDRSLIMGLMLSSQVLQNWLSNELLEKFELSFIGSLILTSIHFEEENSKVGPSKLAGALGVSRSRISQELSKLEGAGLLKRSISRTSARSIHVVLTSAGEKRVLEIVKSFTRLQRRIDQTIGEQHAESVNRTLLKLADALRQA